MNAEVKFTVHPSSMDAARRGFQDILDQRPDKRRAILFLDQADTALQAAGVILRLRESLGDPQDSDVTVKLRGSIIEKVPAEFFALGAGEMDVHSEGEGRSAPSFELKTKVTGFRVAEVLAGSQPAGSLFTPDQSRLLALLNPKFRWSGLGAWGSIDSRTWKFPQPGLARKVTIEHWVAAGREILEFSSDVDAEKAPAFAASLLLLMKEKSILGFGEGKTTWAFTSLQPVRLP